MGRVPPARPPKPMGSDGKDLALLEETFFAHGEGAALRLEREMAAYYTLPRIVRYHLPSPEEHERYIRGQTRRARRKLRQRLRWRRWLGEFWERVTWGL